MIARVTARDCIRILTSITLCLAAPALAQDNSEAPHPMAVTVTEAFPGCCPRPDWWDDVEMDRVISTSEEFYAVWQDKALSDNQKAKAMFRAIEDYHRSDPDIAAPALTYYYWVDRKYPHMRKLYEFGAAAFIDFDRSQVNYSGRTGDLSAGLINRLAQIYLREGLPERAAPLLRYMLDKRGNEINDHLAETAAVNLGEALSRLGRNEEAVAILLDIRRERDGDWEERIDEQLARARALMGPSYYLHDTRYSLPAVGLLAFVIIAVIWIRPRRREASRRVN